MEFRSETEAILAMAILPWAKEHHPEKYKATLEVASRPAAFRNYMARLIEIRWQEDVEWRMSAPLDALEETSIRARFRHRPSNRTIEVAGRLSTPRLWAWGELAEMLEKGVALTTAMRVKDALELEVADPPPDRSST